MVRASKRGKATDSKTERIASMFTENPLKEMAPKDISRELGYEIQLVTTIVNRLRTEGLVERTGRGRYRLKVDQVIEDRHIGPIIHDMKEMAHMVLGSKVTKGPWDDGNNSFRDLVELYQAIRSTGGDTLAANILRLSAKKTLIQNEVDVLLGSVEEVAPK